MHEGVGVADTGQRWDILYNVKNGSLEGHAPHVDDLWVCLG